MSKVAFDFGHGCPYDGGAIGIVTEESIINSVGKNVIEIWREEGNEAIETRPSNAFSLGNSLEQRCTIANANNCDLMVSIHANVTAGGHGVEVFTYRGKELESARMVLDNIAGLGLANRGIKGASLYITNNSNMDAMLIEVLFCDSETDLSIYNEKGIEAFAHAIVEGIKCHVASYSNGESDPVYQEAIKAYNPVQSGKEFIGIRCAELQEKLISLGYSCGDAGADGDFGINTYNALTRFQNEHGLVADGLAGELTFEKLNYIAPTTPIQSGDNIIAKLQRECNSQGFSNQTVDGLPGPSTLEGCPTLRRGANGNITGLLQELLKAKGFDPGTIDNDFGDKTAAAVEVLQKAYGLNTDIIVGKMTWSKLLGL